MVIKILILVLFVMLFPMMSAAQQYVPTENEEIYGTWVNTGYTQGMGASYWASYWQKIVHSSGGTIKSYMSAEDMAHFTGAYTIVAKWTDSHGNILYKLMTKWGDKTYGGETTLYELHRVSNSGLTLEYITSLDDYATEIDPNHREYHIYYRQK
jgi:hypothetical protein